jgi:DsbC/DsbD-like thiol-disulfide interchange protein
MRAVALILAFLAGGGQRGLNPFATAPGPSYVTVSTSASLASVKPGEKVSLFLDIKPNPGIHVYAPGAQGYITVSLVLTPTDVVVPSGTVTFPKSETYFFEALNERVPVYQKPFRLTQAVTVTPTLKSPTPLTIIGMLKYQACDDKVCYAPVTTPIDWLLPVAPPVQNSRPTKG